MWCGHPIYMYTYAYLDDDNDNDYVYDNSVYVCGHICVSSVVARQTNNSKKTNDRVSVRRRKTQQIININKSHLQICALDESERNGAILWQLTLNLYKNKNRSLVCFVCAWTKSASKKIWNYSTEIVLLCLFGQLNGINRLTLTFNKSMNRNNCWYQSIL